jgi:hypothetical protein
MPTTFIDRRRLLLGLAAASTGAAAAVVASSVTTAAPAAIEDAELVRLGDMLPAAAAEMTASVADYQARVRKARSRWPSPPEAIVKHYNDSRDWERNIEGAAILPDGGYPEWPLSGLRPKVSPRSLYSVEECEREVAGCDRVLNRKRVKHPLSPERIMSVEAYRAEWCDMLAAARQYEAAKARVSKACGYEAAKARKETAEQAITELVSGIMARQPVTMSGLVIQAQALEAWKTVPYHNVRILALKWQQHMAASVLRIAEQSAQELAA